MKTYSVKLAMTLALSTCLLGLGAASAVAQEASSEQAMPLFEEAVADYMAGRYDQSSLKFRQAYQMLPEATFLYNLAKSLQKLENYEQALIWAKKAKSQKERPLPPELLVKVDKLIPELEEQYKVQQEEIAAKEALENQTRLGAIGWTGIGLSAVGLGVTAWSVVLGNQVDEDIDALNRNLTSSQYDSAKKKVEDDQSFSQILFISGVSVAAVGAGLLVWDLMTVETPEPATALEFFSTGSDTYVGLRRSW